MMLLSKLINYIRIVWYSWWFNFHYLPIKQAVRLPIFLWKPKLLKCKGRIEIKGDIYPGKIRLGFWNVSIYPDNGIMWENHGGIVVFNGASSIGNDSAISVGNDSIVEIGTNFKNTCGLKLVSYNGIKIGDNCLLGWNNILMDTNFHEIYDISRKSSSPTGGCIKLGDHNWFAADCRILHSVVTPPNCIFSLGTIVTRSTPMEAYSITGGQPPRILRQNVEWD